MFLLMVKQSESMELQSGLARLILALLHIRGTAVGIAEFISIRELHNQCHLALANLDQIAFDLGYVHGIRHFSNISIYLLAKCFRKSLGQRWLEFRDCEVTLYINSPRREEQNLPLKGSFSV